MRGSPPKAAGARVVVEAESFPQLLAALAGQGYRLVGPSLEDGHFVYREIRAVQDLPIGWTDEQEGGTFRLERRGDQALFGYGVGQHSWKQFLLPPRQVLWEAHYAEPGFKIMPRECEAPKMAFIGAHACDLQAIAVQDRVFLAGRYPEPHYRATREQVFIVAVNCAGRTCGTCFCVSMGAGPRATSGFDLALTEVLTPVHYFIAEVGTARGGEILREVAHRGARPEEVEAADRLVAETARNMGRVLDPTGIKDLLYSNYRTPPLG